MLVLVLLTLFVSNASAGARRPDNYCTTVAAVAVVGGYDVDATGSGRYARVRDLTAGVTVVASDFGAGATVYSWDALALDTAHQYQVQVSHTSLTTGYSTSGCVFTPGPPLAAEIEFFALAECENVFYFVTTSEINNYAYQILGNGWSSGMVYGMNYPSPRGGTYAVAAPTDSEYVGDYTLCTYFDGGYSFCDDVAERICEWPTP